VARSLIIVGEADEGTEMMNSGDELGNVQETGPAIGEKGSSAALAMPRLRSIDGGTGGAIAHAIPDGFDFRFGVRSARSLRRLRRQLFGYDMYSGPAWEILLHLFESHVLERRDTVGNVTDGTELPGATSLRWITRLEQEGLIRLRDDHLDRRRRYVELTDAGAGLMTRYFSGVSPHPMAA
jgi:DNA-binding MarR family transcriptional regulator